MKAEQNSYVLITGASGLIGSRLVQALAPRYPVVALDVQSPQALPPGAAFYECDLTSDSSVASTLSKVAQEHGERIVSVIHLAAYYDFSGQPSDLYEELTVQGTRRLLHGLAAFTVDQFVFCSTLLVMKSASTEETISESSPLDPSWEYPQSKIATEELIEKTLSAGLHGDMKAVIMRLAGVYDERGHSPPLTHQLARIHEKQFESHFFPGNAQHGQPFVHLDDSVEAFKAIISAQSQLDTYEVFLIAEPHPVPYRELQDRMGQLLHGHDWTTLRVPAFAARAGAWAKDKLTSKDQFIKPWMIAMADAHYPVSIEKAKTKLGWSPRHRLLDDLEAMATSLKREPERFYQENHL